MMKRLLTAALVLTVSIGLRAQCPGCTPFDCSATTPDGGLCDTILIGMANHAMDEQISFYMPKEIYTTLLPGGGYVQLDKIKITGVVGLPLGLNWESNHSPANEYFPQSGDTIGCVRVCGTPLQADTFRLVVYLLADVTAPVVGQVKNNSQTYNNAVVIILPDTSGGVSSFSVDPPVYSSCDPLSLSFDALLTSNTNPVTYDWDFGNGTTATGKIPPAQTYSDAGSYPITLTTTIREYVIRTVRVIQVNGGWTGDIEELTSFLNSPDVYFTIPSLGYRSSEKTNTGFPATWNNLSIHIPIGTTEFELRIYDKDNGPPLGSQDDSLGSAIISVATGSPDWIDRNGTVTNGDIVITDTIGSVFSETLDIEIGVTPQPVLSVLNGDSICNGDTTVITLSGDDILQYAWYKDSVYQQDVTDSFYKVTASGSYWVQAISPSGCEAVSEPTVITVLAAPPVPSVGFNGTNQVYASNSANVSLQWYLNGSPVPGATNYILTVSDTGRYTVEYTNSSGCRKLSREVEVLSIITGNHLQENAGAVLFPNPGNGLFEILLSESRVDVQILIADAFGKVVLQSNLPAGENQTLIDLRQQPAGIYFCTLRSGKWRMVEKMLILK